MAEIKIKGYQELVFVEESEAREIDELVRNEKVLAGKMFNVGNITVKKSEIQFVVFGAKRRDDPLAKNEKEYEEWIRNERKLSPLAKAQRDVRRRFLFMFEAFRNRKPKNEEIQVALRSAIAYFEKNLKSVFCNSFEWKELFQPVTPKPTPNGFALCGSVGDIAIGR